MAKRKSIYLFSNGELKGKDGIIYFRNDESTKKIIMKNISEIYVLGEVDISKEFLEFISKAEITIHFFNYYGYYSGSFYPNKHISFADTVLKQVEYYLDNRKRLYIAMLFVEGAVKNILQVIRYYMNRGKDLIEIETNIRKLEEIIYTCTNVNELMAIEGNIRNYYYQAFDIILKNPDFIFEQRSKRPPRNHLNTLISFGNSMMYTTVLSQIYYTHLDPRIGYLHATNFRRYTLNLDVAEIFKPIIVDRVIFTVINKNIITSDDFETLSEGIMLKEKGREIFVQHFEDKLNSTISLRNTEENISYKDLIKIELNNLEKYLIYGEKYNTFTARW